MPREFCFAVLSFVFITDELSWFDKDSSWAHKTKCNKMLYHLMLFTRCSHIKWLFWQVRRSSILIWNIIHQFVNWVFYELSRDVCFTVSPLMAHVNPLNAQLETRAYVPVTSMQVTDYTIISVQVVDYILLRGHSICWLEIFYCTLLLPLLLSTEHTMYIKDGRKFTNWTTYR